VILSELLDLKEDGSFRMNMDYFQYCQGLAMTSRKFDDLFGGPPRAPEAPITEREMDLAASVQAVTEEVMLRMSRHVHEETGMRDLVLAGGVALNCVGNGRILREGPFENIWVQPAAGDAGGALGTAMFIWHQLLGRERTPSNCDSQNGSLLGPHYSDEAIVSMLSQRRAVFNSFDSEEQLCQVVADLLAQEKVVGWFQGRMEFGPRALGSRSILGDARSKTMQSVMNLKIKFRESFRPFAPIVLREHVDRYFEMRPHEDSPYMLIVAPVRNEIRCELDGTYERSFGIDKLNYCRSSIPAVTHVDYSARVQTVDRERNPLLHRLMTCFHEATGCPVLINTSFNVRGEPIVCTPEDAYRCFLMTDMDVLVMGRQILLKENQVETATETDRMGHLAQFQLD
jgi:carbamoyltransferase